MNCHAEIQIPRFLAKFVLWFSQFFAERILVLVCKGYGNDYKYYTGLCWDEDHHLDFINDDSYWDFRLWLNFGKVEPQ